MAFQQGIVDRFTGALATINAGLVTAGMETVSTADGIVANLMTEITSWPYIIVRGPKWSQQSRATEPFRMARATVNVEIGICAGDEATASTRARTYGDVVRAGFETYVPSGTVLMCECVSGDADGVPVQLESGLPARLVRQTYQVTACYDHGQV